MTPDEAMTVIEQAREQLQAVRLWIERHDARASEMGSDDVRKVTACGWMACEASRMLYELHSSIGRMDLKSFGANA